MFDWVRDIPILSVVCYLPLVGALMLIFFMRKSEGGSIRRFATGVALIDFLISIPLWFAFERDGEIFQFRESASWIESIGVRYEFGIDGIALLLVLLDDAAGLPRLPFFLERDQGPREGVLHLHAPAPDRDARRLHGDGLLPVLRLLGSHAGADVLPDRHLGRSPTALRGHQVLPLHPGGIGPDAARHPGALLLQQHRSSGLGRAGQSEKTFFIPQFHEIASQIPPDLQFWIFIVFFVGFAIKVPMFPFHTWLPDAHVEAPTAGSVILAGVLLKMGTYGFVRFSLPILPQATLGAPALDGGFVDHRHPLRGPGCHGAEGHEKAGGLLVGEPPGLRHAGHLRPQLRRLNGGILQMINHGLSTGALFLLVGIIYERRHTRMIADYGGISVKMPVFATMFLIITMSSIGLPTLNGFIGEFTILVGAFNRVWWWALLAGIGIVLGAAYMLWMYQRVFFGPMTNPENEKLEDLNGRELALPDADRRSLLLDRALSRGPSSGCSRSRWTTSSRS